MQVLKMMGATLMVALLTTAALAHSKVINSNPPDGGIAELGTENLQIGFTKPVRVMMVRIIHSETKNQISVIKKGTTSFTKSYEVVVPPLARGGYRVNWSAVAKDGHVMKGGLTFTVKP